MAASEDEPTAVRVATTSPLLALRLRNGIVERLGYRTPAQARRDALQEAA
jgi:hypothetical protein